MPALSLFVCLLLSKHLGGNHGSPARVRQLYLPGLGVPWCVLKQERLKTTYKLVALDGTVVSHQTVQRKRYFKALQSFLEPSFALSMGYSPMVQFWSGFGALRQAGAVLTLAAGVVPGQLLSFPPFLWS